MTTELCYLSAEQALGLFKSGKLSPVELLTAQIKQAEAVNGRINAFVRDRFDAALALATTAERAYRQGSPRPLEGLPVAVKDEHNIEGEVTTNGSLLLKSAVAAYTDPICERLLSAGAIILARTATPEFSANYVTWSKLWGVTRNPWNRAFTVGGSSGGSAAALAAGMATLATGSDIGGSVRGPAAQNGVVGYKPPRGRVPKYPPANLIHYYSDGPLARTVRDVILFENIISGPHRCDMTSLKPKYDLPFFYDSLNGLRVGCCVQMGGKPVDVDVRKNTLMAAEVLQDLGAAVDEVDIGWDVEQANEAALTYLAFMFGGSVELNFANHPEFPAACTSYVQYFVALGSKVTRAQYLRAMSYETFMYTCVAKLFDTYDVLICPTVSIASLPADFDYSKDRLIVDGKEDATLMGPLMTHYFNALSRCPALSVPSGFDRNRVPTAIQIVGPSYEEENVFRVAMAFEKAMPPLFINDRVPTL